jgi:hypothetical protein
MATPRKRLALGGGALVILFAVGVGFVQASSVGAGSAPAAANNAAAPATTATDGADVLPAALRLRGRGLVVHGTITIDSPKDGLITVQLDGGTIAAVDGDSVTIAEKGGGSVTVAIDKDTRVRRDRKRATAADLKVGDTVRVVSRVADGGAATARVIAVTAAPGG